MGTQILILPPILDTIIMLIFPLWGIMSTPYYVYIVKVWGPIFPNEWGNMSLKIKNSLGPQNF